MSDKHADKNMTLAPGVIDTIISITAREVEGVAQVGTAASGGLWAKLTGKPSTLGIETRFDDEGKLAVVLHIAVYYGCVLPEVADKLRTAISDALLVQAGVEVASVDIFVDAIQFDQAQ